MGGKMAAQAIEDFTATLDDVLAGEGNALEKMWELTGHLGTYVEAAPDATTLDHLVSTVLAGLLQAHRERLDVLTGTPGAPHPSILEILAPLLVVAMDTAPSVERLTAIAQEVQADMRRLGENRFEQLTLFPAD